jgi:hypothetical protein
MAKAKGMTKAKGMAKAKRLRKQAMGRVPPPQASRPAR